MTTSFILMQARWPILAGIVLGTAGTSWAQMQMPEALASARANTPLTADVTVTTSFYTPFGKSTQTQSGKYYRSSSGLTRQDFSSGSTITDPVARTIISINHQGRRATLIHLPKAPNAPSGTAQAPSVIAPPTGKSSNLGESTIDGHLVVGKRNESPGLAAAKQAGTTVTEVWTSDELHLPIWTRQTSSGGENSQKYENIKVGEPDPSVFLVPSGYTLTERIAAAPGQPIMQPAAK